MTVFVHPVMGDACPNVVAEALASGTPVVTPAFGGTSELVGDGGIIFETNPWVYDSNFIDSLTASVVSAIEKHPSLSIQARLEAEEKLDINRMLDNYLRVMGVEVPNNIKIKPSSSSIQLKQSLSTMTNPSRYMLSMAIRKGVWLMDSLLPSTPNRKPRIAFTLFDFQIGGIENWLLRLAVTLNDQFDFYFLSTRVKEFLPHFSSVGTCDYLPDPGSMIRYLRRNRIDLVQVHNQRWPIDAALAAGVPRVIERLGGPRSWLRAPKYGLDYIIASSNMAAEAVMDVISPDRISVIYNGISLDHVDQSQTNRLFPDDNFILGRTSRFGHGQNLQLLVQAVARLRSTNPDLRLVLVGSDSALPGAAPVFQELNDLADSLGIIPLTHFTGPVADPVPYVKGFDAGTCVSNDEGIPNSLIEAMACMKPVIATNVGAIPEFIINMENGLLIQPGNVSQLCDAIKLLKSEEKLFKKLAAAARETIQEKFDIGQNAAKYAANLHTTTRLSIYSTHMTDIICVSTTDWHEIWGSRQQIMLRLAALGNRILFVERQVGPEHLIRDRSIFRKKTASNEHLLHKINENIWLYNPPLILPGRYYSMVSNNFSQRYLAKRIYEQSERLQFHAPLLWIYPPQSAPLLGNLDEKLVVYHCIDKFSAGQTGRKRVIIDQQESELLTSSDCIFVHGRRLLAHQKRITQKPVYLLPSAADLSLFLSQPPADSTLGNIPHPRLGIFGSFDGRLDSSLLVDLCQENPLWNVVMVGPIRPGIRSLDRLKSLPNLHILGHRSHQELPSLMYAADVQLLPYVLNELTEYINPLKIYEYLAVGKPVVSTNLPELDGLREVIYLAKDKLGFIESINNALLETDQEKIIQRKKEAMQHDWNQRIDTIIETLKTFGVNLDVHS